MPRAVTDIKSLARAHTRAAILTLKGCMHAADAPWAARVAAAVALLNRGWGQPEQDHNVKGEMKHYVIRAPSLSDDAETWTIEHVPPEHKLIETEPE